MQAQYVGEAVGRLLEDEEISGVQLAWDLNISEQLVSHIKNNRRKMQPDIAEHSIRKMDNPFYTMHILHKFADYCSPPVFRGRSVEEHRLAFEEVTITEAREAIETLEEVSFVKSPSLLTNDELEKIKYAIGELLDIEAWAKNLAAILCAEYQISWKEAYKSRIPTWKAKGWME